MGFFISYNFVSAVSDNSLRNADVSFETTVQQHIAYAQTSKGKKYAVATILRDDLQLRAWSRRYSAREVQNITTAMRVFDRASDALLRAYDVRIASLQASSVTRSDLVDKDQVREIYRAQDRLYNAYLEALYLH